jgi:D-3-phosphoglycerate dehydrogenase / 2-oxoglutarate reductase
MRILVFDFDSTLVRSEGLDELFARSLEGSPDRERRVTEFRAITDRGMSGELAFAESLALRLALLEANRDVVREVGASLADDLTPSVARNLPFFRDNPGRVYVLSGGFRELIEPAANVMGIAPDHIRANRFRFDGDGRVVGLDSRTLLARGGKAAALAGWKLDPGQVWVIGDGATDLELRELGLASRFVAFTENRQRDGVADAADHVARCLEDVLVLLGPD